MSFIGISNAFGITPAGAGKTATGTAYEKEGRDHPRRCGENHSHEKCSKQWAGSPPQVRGKLSSRPTADGSAGITPAGAGKTDSSSLYVSSARDHPRRCGENSVLVEPLGCLPGSPPQVRGKHGMAVEYLANPGITPAGAGKTRPQQRVQCPHRDHPRRCGENCSPTISTPVLQGSPPQVRGKHIAGRVIQ